MVFSQAGLHSCLVVLLSFCSITSVAAFELQKSYSGDGHVQGISANGESIFDSIYVAYTDLIIKANSAGVEQALKLADTIDGITVHYGDLVFVNKDADGVELNKVFVAVEKDINKFNIYTENKVNDSFIYVLDQNLNVETKFDISAYTKHGAGGIGWGKVNNKWRCVVVGGLDRYGPEPDKNRAYVFEYKRSDNSFVHVKTLYLPTNYTKFGLQTAEYDESSDYWWFGAYSGGDTPFVTFKFNLRGAEPVLAGSSTQKYAEGIHSLGKNKFLRVVDEKLGKISEQTLYSDYKAVMSVVFESLRDKN